MICGWVEKSRAKPGFFFAEGYALESFAEKLNQVVLFTDFGERGPYVGQVELAYRAEGGTLPVIRLMSDAPQYRPEAAGLLLAALNPYVPERSLVIAVVDPGVGTDRRVLYLSSEGRGYLGPDNRLFNELLRRASNPRLWEVTWRPKVLSRSFHGRDLFAPIAALITQGRGVRCRPIASSDLVGWGETFDVWQIVYLDAYGNAWTGIHGADLPEGSELRVGAQQVAHAHVFGAVQPGQPFWFVNSVGLVEIAINQGSAETVIGIRVGMRVEVISGTHSGGIDG